MSAAIKNFAVKGMPPMDEPLAGPAIEARLREELARKDADHAANRSEDPARLRAGDAGKCARQVAFHSLDVPKDLIYTAAQILTFQAGDFYHQVTQEALVRFADARCEVDFDFRPDHDLYGRCDFVTSEAAGEIKSQGSYGFDLCVGARRSDAGPGPKVEHLLQVGLAALSPQIDRSKVHIIYVNKDRSTTAEWLIDVDEPLRHLGYQSEAYNAEEVSPLLVPTVRSLVTDELERLGDVLAQMDDDVLPGREIPGVEGYVADPLPEPGATRVGALWLCAYCGWNPTCSGLSAGPDYDFIPLRRKTEAGS